MSPKSLVLAATAVSVVGMGIYLFLAVNESPTQASPTTATERSEPRPTVASRTPTTPTRDTPPPPTAVGDTQARPKAPDRQIEEIDRQLMDPPQVDDRKVDLKLDNMMEAANKAYDRQDFEEAIAIASKLLTKDPTNVRMLRIMVSASCIQGDSAIAQTHYEKLPEFDRQQMRTRCDRYGVSFKEPAQ